MIDKKTQTKLNESWCVFEYNMSVFSELAMCRGQMGRDFGPIQSSVKAFQEPELLGYSVLTRAARLVQSQLGPTGSEDSCISVF